jgi:hypothetical protein
VWIPWRCCIWSTWIGRAARASQEGREQLHCLLPSTRSSTSRRIRCICASSGNPVISGSSSSCFAGKILFCASVATPYPFNPLPSYLLLVIIILATSGRGASMCRQDQSAALLRLKASFRFNTTSPTCLWFSFDEETILSRGRYIQTAATGNV